MKKNLENGLSLIEILVVVTIFAVLGVIISSSLILTIQGTKKSESLIKVRENINYSLAVIERNLRNASVIVDCPNTDTSKITYMDQYGISSSFSCMNVGAATDSYIASGSARLTSNSIKVIQCSFVCTRADLSNPPSVKVNLTVQDTTYSGSQGSNVTTESKIYLRN